MGIYANCNLEIGNVLISVPNHLLLCEANARSSLVGTIIDSFDEDELDSHNYLAAFLLEDLLNKTSKFQLYYESLPKSFPNNPINWSVESLSYLKGSFMLQQIENRKISLQDDYQILCNIIPSFSRHSLNDFIWIRTIISTRVFSVERSKKAIILLK